MTSSCCRSWYRDLPGLDLLCPVVNLGTNFIDQRRTLVTLHRPIPYAMGAVIREPHNRAGLRSAAANVRSGKPKARAMRASEISVIAAPIAKRGHRTQGQKSD